MTCVLQHGEIYSYTVHTESMVVNVIDPELHDYGSRYNMEGLPAVLLLEGLRRPLVPECYRAPKRLCSQSRDGPCDRNAPVLVWNLRPWLPYAKLPHLRVMPCNLQRQEQARLSLGLDSEDKLLLFELMLTG